MNKKCTLKNTCKITYPTGEIRNKVRMLELLAKLKGLIEEDDDVYILNDKGLSKKSGKKNKWTKK